VQHLKVMMMMVVQAHVGADAYGRFVWMVGACMCRESPCACACARARARARTCVNACSCALALLCLVRHSPFVLEVVWDETVAVVRGIEHEGFG